MTSFWTDRSWRIDRMVWRFKRSGGFGNETWPYDQLPQGANGLISRRVTFEAHEVGLVVYVANADTWTLLTSDRLLGQTHGKAFSLELQDIREVRPETFTPEGRSSLADADGNPMQRPVEILILKSGHGTHNLSIEGPAKSGPCLGLWNVILMVMQFGSRREA